MNEPRLQNPRAAIGGSFASSKQMSNDTSAGASKSAPTSILDRFKTMLKEPDEEVRVSLEDGGISPSTMDMVVRLYEIVLSELTFNSKPIITELTIIAGEQREHGQGIANAICARILEAPVEHKLPSLYLLDSIVKNIGREYIRHFSARLPEVFCEAYRQVQPNMFAALRHLFGTWSTVFPSSVLRKIEACLQFSPSTSHQSSGLTNLRASESPRPGHGIHVNPKYLEARRQLVGHSTINAVGAEKLSSTGRAGLISSDIDAVKLLPTAAARTVRPSSPFGVGRARSLSPPVDDFAVESSPQISERPSPSHSRIDYGLNGVMAGDDETIDWHRNLLHDDSSQRLENSVAYSVKKGIDLQGPRALIDAYGIDEREKAFNYHHHKLGQPDANGIGKRVGVKTWQNTEEEEFNWEDMSPTLGDPSRRNDFSSSMPPSRRFITGPSVGSLQAISAINDSRRSLSDQAQHSLSGRGITSKIPGFYEEASLISAPSYSQEPQFLPQDFPQQSHHRIRVEGGGRAPSMLSGTGLSTKVGEQKLHLVGNLTTANGKFWRPPSVASRVNPGFNSSVQDVQAVNTGLSTGAWPTISMHNLPRFPVQHPGAVPLNHQRSGQMSLSQPQLPCHDVLQNKVPPAAIAVPTHTLMPPSNYGYTPQGQGVSGVQSTLPMVNIPNTSLQFTGAALAPIARVPTPAAPQMMPTLQPSGQGTQSAPQGGTFSNLINTLMAQGLISLSNQAPPEDSVGTEFNMELLKERHESTITALYSALPRQCKTCGLRFKSQDAHSSHMDWHVTKNRLSKNRKHNPSRKWFVSLSMWLSSAEALGTDAVPGFLPLEDVVEKKDDDELAVPADDEQNACALCGEPFDDFYSDETEEWMYRGAVYMNAPTGSTTGMDRSQLGPIVHAKCRSESSSSCIEASKKHDEGYTDDGGLRKRMRS
ncbi:PREDICTED: polyadenylation and cleavage factor homolog 4-like isoform X2 [Ipomoea nil]|uniref:polyadenylation and cleavage factor homolog 4-like isoform X2 n=1 Tax=Ipomoea nil TaxID=35883 RepID=UPI0009012BC9|nr:PREDICTED: polyadenylation and cleavage factor homolog 4-like isoform X2 [Ipomoea nil]